MATTASPTAAAGLAIMGNVHGGQQPVVNAHVYLMAANTTGYGASSTSLLSALSTTHSDSVGAYVLTGADGSFSISGDYTCTQNQQAYLYVLGGNPGAGVNSAAGFLAAIGNCPASGSFATQVPFIFVNEVSTVAAAYAMAGFATDATHVAASNTTLAQTGLANAFANATNLVNIATGVPYTTTPVGNGTVPTALLNTLANILASCVNTNGPGSVACSALFSNARSGGSSGPFPTDTATAIINIAHNPGTNVQALFNIPSPAAAFAPSLTARPNDFTVGINFTGGGVTGSGLNGAYSIATNANGEVWITNINNNTVSKLSSTGAPQSPPTGFTSAGQGIPTGVAIDSNANAWISSSSSASVVEYNNSGIPISTPVTGYSLGAGTAPQAIAIDGNSNVFTADFGTNGVSRLDNGGVVQSPAGGYTGGGLNGPQAIAVDGLENIWVANQRPGLGTLSKLQNNGVPLTTVNGFTGGGLNDPFGIAIDALNQAWTANFHGNSVSLFSDSGAALSTSAGITGGGLNAPYALAIDGAGTVWVANSGNNSVSEILNSGIVLSPSTGFTGGTINAPNSIDVDLSGNVWIANTNSANSNAVTQLIGASVPAVRPLSLAVAQSKLGTRP